MFYKIMFFILGAAFSGAFVFHALNGRWLEAAMALVGGFVMFFSFAKEE